MATDALRAQVAAKWQESFTRLNQNEPGIVGLLNFSQAWNIARECIRPRGLDEPDPLTEYDKSTFQASFELLNKCRRLPILLETFLDDMRKRLPVIKEEVDQYTLEYERTSDTSFILNLVFRLLQWYNKWMPRSELGATLQSAFVLSFQTHIFSILTPTFVRGFKELCASTLPPSDPSTSAPEPNIKMWEAFETLGLLDRYENIIASVGYEHIEAHVVSNFAGQWSTSVLGELRKWMTNQVVPWMLLMYGRNATTTDDARAMLQNVGSRFDFHMAKTLCDLRTKEIFDIIIDFPESTGALQDLKECLHRVDQRANLVHTLRKANHKRLLHPGADTRLILTQYVATIKCLRVIDPPGVLLFKVADPIRRYLRERPDTIRCIISNLTGDDDSGDPLVDDSEPIQPLHQTELEEYNDPNWEPEPVDAGPDFRANKPSDIVSTLVSIYDSKDLFVKELQVLLAQRLLSVTDDDSEKVEKERRSIEILKIRFGEAALQACEVMLKDMSDSKRIDGHVQSQNETVLHPTIISKHFWPMLEATEIVMPGQFRTLQEEYAKRYSTFKPDKQLRWLPHLGTVHLELQLEDRTIETNVPPLEAAFIELFSQQNVWTMDKLIDQVGSSVDKAAALKALLTWVDLGVLKEEGNNTFSLLEVADAAGTTPREPRAVANSAMELPSAPSVQQQQAEQMKVYWKFIEGMLTNLGSLPVDRIQNMLKLAPGYDQTVEQLGIFMEAARLEGLVVVRDGIWKLTPK
ncbi:hypothetical protein BT96DRAFT_964565 [Gymnopus androsaceus JB14]|uniref:Anaphase-promoting complex subunit 2 n=1 Tax=Gymnopus androsaceus JB14 TaxID=1447944 RepID=A0A6A4HZV0_9AGAR|nr:hypothetical protein BT96DRAFT_964565 [Gymnopus androsaceus JB14]